MNRWIVFGAAAGCAFLTFACATRATLSGVVVADVTVVSPERAAPLKHAYVRIVDGRIAEVSERRLRGEVEIEGRGRYLIPGLIDSTAQWNARELRPDAYFCSAVAVVNGELRLVPFPYFSYGVTGDKQILPVDPTRHTPEAVVARITSDGARCVKTIYERGFTPTVDEVKPLVAAAHARNLPVFIHANRKRAQAFAVAVGADVIVHGMWRDPGEDAALDEEAHAVLANVVRDDIGYQPTTQVIAGLLDMTHKDYLARADVAEAYPSSLIDLYRSKEGAAGTPLWLRLAGIDAQAQLRGTIGRATEATRILAQADAHLLFGSDTPSDLIYTNPPGLNGRIEMDHWIAAGVSLEKLFRALTIDNARMLQLQDQIGTVESGKTANLLLLRGDPLGSVEAYDTIETVFLHGRPISRDVLSARAATRAVEIEPPAQPCRSAADPCVKAMCCLDPRWRSFYTRSADSYAPPHSQFAVVHRLGSSRRRCCGWYASGSWVRGSRAALCRT